MGTRDQANPYPSSLTVEVIYQETLNLLFLGEQLWLAPPQVGHGMNISLSRN